MTRRSPVALDTSVVIAALLSWHESHEAAAAALEAALADAAGAVLPLPALVEAYAVMTRLPAPHRLRPSDAAEILSASLGGRVRLVTLSEADAWPLITSLADTGIAGGRTYDAFIAACARAAPAGRLMTFNARDFAAVAPDLELIVP
ncbi:MAG TPA: PIN domain-containing protein [Thermoanaerobaculia bacterium]|nr:PIN domain-containing protein [Thermoanaerobaculia bacterium]